MIHKADAHAALDRVLRESAPTDYLQRIDEQGRLIIDALFDGRAEMSREEADIATLILKQALIGMMAARTTSIVAGDGDPS